MSAADLTSLRERLGKATGADRELDAALMMALCPPNGQAFWNWRGIQPKGTQDRALADVQTEYARKAAPAYTSSLDAALGLVEARESGAAIGYIITDAVAAWREAYVMGRATVADLPRFVLSALLAALSEQRP